MPSSVAISPFAFVTEEEVATYIGRGASLATAQLDVASNAINWATNYMRQACGRDLKARTRSIQRTAAVTLNATSPHVRASGAAAATLALARVGDPIAVAGATFPSMALVTVAWDGVGVAVAGSAAVAAGSGTATFGDGGLIMDGTGDRAIDLDEFPLQALYAAYWRDPSGALVAIDTTNAVLEHRIGRITIFNDIFWRGASNLLIECRVGYDEPSGSTFGDVDQYEQLKTVSLRLCELYWQNWQTPGGRQSETRAGSMSASPLRIAVPPDLSAMLRGFARIGA